ncbi:chorismate mutase [Halosimplex sp. J119]
MTDDTDELAELRGEIDRLDGAIADLVAERVETAEAVAEVKADAGRDLVDEGREETVKSHHESLFEERGLDGTAGRDLAELLIETSLEHERSTVAAESGGRE